VLLYLLFAVWPVKSNEVARCATQPCSGCATQRPGSSPAPTPSPSSTPTSGQQTPTPPQATPTPSALTYYPCVTVFGSSTEVPLDIRLLWIVGIAAALGSFVQVGTSFSTFVGNGNFLASWLWWYLLRAPIGIALAYLFYFAVRGGLVSASGSAADISPFGIAALAGLVGLFSKQASDKLEEVFRTAFRTAPGAGDDARTGKLGAPAITSLSPDRISIKSATKPVVVTIKGTGFTPGLTAMVDAKPRPTEPADATALKMTLADADLAAPATLSVTVKGPASAPVSNAVSLKIEE
jgi:hypothetical protein